jgi:hypothetical protein
MSVAAQGSRHGEPLSTEFSTGLVDIAGHHFWARAARLHSTYCRGHALARGGRHFLIPDRHD